VTKRKPKQRPYSIKAYQRAALEFLAPPEDVTVSQWAEEHRILDVRSSAMPGHWKEQASHRICPEIMDTG
jgi:phage terminase large subunit GpA-like protein